jgi:hypothetical protein
MVTVTVVPTNDPNVPTATTTPEQPPVPPTSTPVPDGGYPGQIETMTPTATLNPYP